jgi:hypothetical protein
MMEYPRAQISPISPTGTIAPVSVLTILISVSGTGRPTVEIRSG